MDLNNPDIRQGFLRTWIANGAPLVAAQLASEFKVSIDTVRRDLIALELAGQVRRVRGGAVPAADPALPMRDRAQTTHRPFDQMAIRALEVLAGQTTLFLDGGTTVLALARMLPPSKNLLVVTPSPWIAVACQTNNVDVVMSGGRLSGQGGINVGRDCMRQLAAVSADAAVLGACGLEASFGLSSDDLFESEIKRQMAENARMVLVVADRSKIGTRARHRTLAPQEIDSLVTTDKQTQDTALAENGTEIFYA